MCSFFLCLHQDEGRGAGLLSWYLGLTKYGDWCSGVVESSRHLCGHASTISDVIRPKDSTKIKDLTLLA
jgi:hypothetical protein